MSLFGSNSGVLRLSICNSFYDNTSEAPKKVSQEDSAVAVDIEPL